MVFLLVTSHEKLNDVTGAQNMCQFIDETES